MSHTFIRREIIALEALGFDIVRYALRPGAKTYVDPADTLENTRTHFIFAGGVGGILGSIVLTLLQSPVSFFKALLLAMRIGVNSDRGLLKHFAYLAEATVIARWARRDRIQHLHVHFGTNMTVVAALAKEISGLRFSFTAHGPEEFENARLLGHEIKVGAAEFVVCVSQFGCSQLMRWIPPSLWPKIKLVHCGVDERLLQDDPPPLPEAAQLACVARFGPEKAHLILIEAIRRLRDEGVTVKVSFLGDGPMRPNIEAAIAAAGLGDAVKLLGWASGPQVKAALAQSRAFVLPSFNENLPVAIMEAMAMGRPVISTYVAGIPELVKPGENGWLAPAGDIEALKQALREVAEATPQRLGEMGAAARARVLRDHDSVKEAGKLKVLFEAAIAGARAA